MSKDNNKKTPKVRFPGFTDDWEERKLGEVCDFINGDRSSNYPSDADFQNSGIPFVGSDSLGATFVNKNKLRFISCEKYKQMKGLKIQDKDILYTLRGAGFGKCSISDFFDGTVASSLVGIRCNEEELEPYFFVQWLNSANAGSEKKKAVNGSTAQNISVNDMKKYMIYLPLQDEQQKVGAYFRNLDHLITLHQRKLEKLKEYKKGMLQKMFPKNGEKIPEVRFPGFDGEWKERKVSELCSISTGKSNTQDKVEDGKYPFYVRSPIIERSTKYLYDEEAVITVGDGVGTGKVFHYVNGKYDLHQRCYRMYGFSDELNAHYFYHTFSKLFYKRVMSMTAKTSVDSVRLEMISDMKIPVPDIEEQRKIGSFLDNLDRLIALQQKKIESLKEFKKGCLQQMFV